MEKYSITLYHIGNIYFVRCLLYILAPIQTRMIYFFYFKYFTDRIKIEQTRTIRFKGF